MSRRLTNKEIAIRLNERSGRTRPRNSSRRNTKQLSGWKGGLLLTGVIILIPVGMYFSYKRKVGYVKAVFGN